MKWIREKPHWRGVYVSKLGSIHRISEGRWYFQPAPKLFYCNTLKSAKKLAEDMAKESGEKCDTE